MVKIVQKGHSVFIKNKIHLYIGINNGINIYIQF